MKKGLLVSILSLLAGGGLATAQEKPAGPNAEPIVVQSSAPLIPYRAWAGEARDVPRIWVSTEYLNWWITRGPVGVPLVTTGDVGSPTGGALGNPNTRVLFGESPIDFGAFMGGRVSLGYWFGADRRFGIEASGLLFGQKTNTFSLASDAAGNPFLAIPVQIAGVETRFGIAGPLVPPVTGSVVITSTSRLWGTDINAVRNIYRADDWSLDLLAGFRYYDLAERLQVDLASNGTVPDGALVFTTFDRFSARNQFYGGQLGAHATRQIGRYSVDLLGQVALGNTHQTVIASGGGAGSIGGVPLPAVEPGGVFTSPTNLGTFHYNNFSVVPQMQIKLGYDITRNLRATIGYDAIYWTGVLRPGNQIDHVIDSGAAAIHPAPRSNRSDLWAHGFSVGLQYRW
jgi:Putative beta barrel porin-7 (BBP7)